MHEITDDDRLKLLFENGLTPSQLGYLMTLENIYKYANDEELEAIVHSIIGRTWEQWKKSGTNPNLLKPTDKELHEVAKGLRKPQ